MGQVLLAGIVPKLTAPVAGLPLSDLMEGQIVMINENGTPVPFYLAKHDYESGLNGAGRMLMVRKNSYKDGVWNSSAVSTYANSTVNAWFNGTYKALLDETVQEAIATTKFYYTVGGGDNTVTTLERSVFTLSLTEYGMVVIDAEISGANNTEGSALPIASTLKTATDDAGEPTSPWTRSADITEKHTAFTANYSLGPVQWIVTTSDVASYRPCFTLPSTAAVSEPNADGSVNLLI